MPLSGTIWRYLVARYGKHALGIRESRQPMKISKTKKNILEKRKNDVENGNVRLGDQGRL